MSLLLKDKVALITGASRGIGAAVAKAYAAQGAHVILVGRTVGALEEVDDAIQSDGNGKATLVPLDLKELDKIDALAMNIGQRFGMLDILVGNAGILGTLGPLAHQDPRVWNEVITVNLTANWRLIRACDPLLRRSKAGRVLFVTSGVTQHAFPFWGPYAVSKAGLEMLAHTYAAEMKNTPVRVNIVDPGVVRTRMRADAMPGEDPLTLAAPEDIADHFVELVSDHYTQTGQRHSCAA